MFSITSTFTALIKGVRSILNYLLRIIVRVAVISLLVIIVIGILYTTSVTFKVGWDELVGVLANFATAGGFVAVAWQLHLYAREQKSQAIAELINGVANPDFRDKVSFIRDQNTTHKYLTELGQKKTKGRLTKEEKELSNKVDDVTGQWDALGWRLRKGYAYPDTIFEMFHGQIIHCAVKLIGYLEQERKMREEEPWDGYPREKREFDKDRANFIWLATQAKRYEESGKIKIDNRPITITEFKNTFSELLDRLDNDARSKADPNSTLSPTTSLLSLDQVL